jgi:hypothetical protein
VRIIVLYWAVPYLRRVVIGFPPQRPGSDPRANVVGLIVNKMPLMRIFLGVLWFLMPVLIPPTAPHSVVIVLSMLYSIDTSVVK